jgi:anaerobic selenocysteine-containing dehydrogenase
MTALDVPTATSVVQGTCHHDCPDSCGWHVTVTDGIAVQLRGDPDHPYSKGELCPKVNRFIDRVYSPERITTPLRRVGAKGEGRFEPISWDEALGEIATRLHGVINEFGPEAVMPYSSAGNQSLLALGFPNRFWNKMGATRLVHAICGATAGAGVFMTNGTAMALDPQQIIHSQLIILWGTNTRLTNRHLWPTVEAARANGAQVIVIDPIRTITADSADWFLQPLPGTDVALMLALMHVLVRDGLVDHEWVAAHTIGFEELAAHVAEWTPTRAAEICSLDPADIEELAHRYGTIRPAAIRTLIGAEHHEHGGMFFRTLACLPALVGAWRDQGGGLARSVGSWGGQLIDQNALDRPELGPQPAPRLLNMSRLADVLTDPTLDPPIKAMVVWGANPMVVVPNAEGIRRGLLRDDLFTVVHEQFITDTARYADIVLPCTTQIESLDVVPSWGHLNIGWNEPAIAPVGEAVSNSELHRLLARAMGFTEPELFHDDLTVLADALPTVDLELMRKQGLVAVPYPEDGRPFGDGHFPTASGRVEFVSDVLTSMGHPALPTFTAARESLAGDAHLTSRFPFALLTPKQHTRFLNSSYSHLPKHGPLEDGPYVEMVAADAERLGVVDGQPVRVWNDRGAVVVPVRITVRLRPNVAAIPWGWWGHQHDGHATANALTNDTLTDWGGGVAFSDTLVAIHAI